MFIIVFIFLFVRLALLKEGCMWQITILFLRNHCFNYHTAENTHKTVAKNTIDFTAAELNAVPFFWCRWTIRIFPDRREIRNQASSESA
jgi:hypothetical protein